jgi:hypothetical protein
MRATLILVAATLILVACGTTDDNASRTAARPTDPAPDGEVPRTAVLDGETYVADRTVPAASFAADELDAAGQGLSDGESLLLARAAADEDVASWELLSAGEAGWQVWRPEAVLRVLNDAGPGATIVSVESVEWPNACLGLAGPDEVCAEVITPGYRVIVERDGERITYHTDLIGRFRIAGPT